MIKFLKEKIAEVLDKQGSGLKGVSSLRPNELKRVIFLLEKQELLLRDLPDLCKRAALMLTALKSKFQKKRTNV